MWQIEVMKSLTKRTIFHLHANSSIISKPQFCTKHIYYYGLTLKPPDYHTTSIPIAEIVNSDQGSEITEYRQFVT